MKNIIIGIDPDLTGCGVAERNATTGEIHLYTMPPAALCQRLTELRDLIQQVRIEAGWLNNKANYHRQGSGERIAARIGKNVGENHAVGKLIAAHCELKGIAHQLVKPLRKMWKGPDKKITHAELISIREMQPKPKRTNQEERDAALLIL